MTYRRKAVVGIFVKSSNGQVSHTITVDDSGHNAMTVSYAMMVFAENTEVEGEVVGGKIYSQYNEAERE